MKIIITPVDGEIVEYEVIKSHRNGATVNYKIKDGRYLGFQFDDSDRPSNYIKEYAETKSFSGYLIGRKGHPSVNCSVKVKY